MSNSSNESLAEPHQVIEPTILQMTERWIVLFKPAGWLTIPPSSKMENSPQVLSEWVRNKVSESWVVHRIDRETSGIVLFARNEKSHREASLWFQNRKVRKEYLCLSQGKPHAPVFKLNAPIQGAPSTTQVEVKEDFGTAFLARVIPRTGRRHQIRIHLSKAGYPLFGDPLYGGQQTLSLREDLNLNFQRVALHAYVLGLPTGEVFQAPLPNDFEQWLESLKKWRSSDRT